jgi:hypothetical protein
MIIRTMHEAFSIERHAWPNFLIHTYQFRPTPISASVTPIPTLKDRIRRAQWLARPCDDLFMNLSAIQTLGPIRPDCRTGYSFNRSVTPLLYPSYQLR